MERLRQKKSKVTNIAEGNKQIQRQRSLPKLASDSSSHSSRTTNMADMFTSESGRSSSRQVTGTPIKKLIAEEMSKEIESKRQPPSVIARLMGLDGLPPQQPLHRQQKGFSGTQIQKTALAANQRDRKSYEHQIRRKKSMEQQEFKDVFEVTETSKVDWGNHSIKGTAHPNISEADMAFIQQRFVDAKRLSADEKLHNSKEFRDTLDLLHSNKNLLVKFLQQPDSLFTKHILDLQGAIPRSQCTHIAVAKPSNSEQYESSTTGWKSKEETSRCDTRSRRKQNVGYSNHVHRGAQTPLKSSKAQLDGIHDTGVLPTRIVVLKPNFDKVQSSTDPVSSPSSSYNNLPDGRKHMDDIRNGSGEAGPRFNKNLHNYAGFTRPNSRASRENAKQIARRIRESFCSEQIDLSSIYMGYAGDESSYDVSGSDSGSESEVTTLRSRKPFNQGNQHKNSSLNLIESSVSREAKKRLSKRWQMSQRYQDVGSVAKGSTLGEMLAISDREFIPIDIDQMIGLYGSSDRYDSSDDTAEWESPLGISSRDGWKDKCVRNSSRLRSIPASSVAYGGPDISREPETLDQNSYLMRREANSQGRNNAIKGSFVKKEDSSFKNLRFHSEKSQSSCQSYIASSDCSKEQVFRQSQMEINHGKKDPSGSKSLVLEMLANNVDNNLVADSEVEAVHADVTISSKRPEQLLQNPSACFLENGNLTNGPEDSKAQCQIPEPHSPASSKEADHPSPVSVLEVPFTEDISSGSECFERVSADLHELRMQLNLLKMESGADPEGDMLTPSDKHVSQGCVAVSEAKGTFQDESLDSSYLADVLIEFGFDDSEPDIFMSTWHSPECPVGPWVFDNLEKKYGDETTWLRAERRLLFDRINSGLLQIFQQFKDSPSRAKLVTPNWKRHGVKFELHKLLASDEKNANEEVTERVLDREMLWLESGNEIDQIGSEVEKMLINDLIAELVDM